MSVHHHQDEENSTQDHIDRHPIEDASFFSRCTFGYAFPLLKLGLERPIQDEDLPPLHHLESSDYNRRLVESLWEEECKHNDNDSNDDDVRNDGDESCTNSKTKQRKTNTNTTNKKNNLGRALFWYYVKSTWWAQCLLVMNMVARICQAVVLGFLMEQFGRYETSNYESHHSANSANSAAANSTNPQNISAQTSGSASTASQGTNAQTMYTYAVLLVICGLVAFPTKQQQFFETYRKGVQLRLGLIAAIYAKTLRLPSTNVGSGGNNDASTSPAFMSSGHLTNLVSNDVERFAQASVVLPFLLYGPLIAIAILIVGMYMIGPVFAFGYIILFLLLPLQVFLGRRFVYFRSQVASLTDKRVTLVSQAVSGARVMKMNVSGLTIDIGLSIYFLHPNFSIALTI